MDRARFGVRPGLGRTAHLMARLGHPERSVPVVHIAGTNGKGSTAALIAAGLRAAGLTTGLYTSPDLGELQERVQVDGALLPEGEWQVLARRVEAAAASAPEPPTLFECLTALALAAFAERSVAVAVLEVGLGGSFDATNVVPVPALTVITPVAVDHQEVLGSTVAAIARDKAGVIKDGGRVVVAPQAPHARAEVVHRAREVGAVLRWPTHRLLWSDASGVTITVHGSAAGVWRTKLLGRHQAGNLALAAAALGWLGEGLSWDWDAVQTGVAQANWPARLEVLPGRPLGLVDGAHNLHAAHALAKALAEPHLIRPWHLVWGTFQDKPSAAMLRAVLPHVASVVLTRPSGPRGQDPAVIRQQLRWPPGLAPVVEGRVSEALRLAVRRAGPGGAVLVAGSLALAGEARQWWALESLQPGG